jgi:iron complex outermembrane recepter protein
MSGAAQDVTLKPVVINARSTPPAADITGFGDVPLKDVPISATVVGREQLQSSGARRLADLAQFDASVSDAYNSPGYWDFVSVRGFTLDNRYNFRREGLPISAETSIPLDNKERVEILKGTSGIQAGTSAPGGLVNYVVKRPTQQNLREVRLEAGASGSVLAGADLGGRFGNDQTFGYRFNAVQEQLRPLTRNLNGNRSLVSLATDWRISRDSVLEAEVEWSQKSQPSQSGFSLLGKVLPAPVDPRLNLNNQPWSQPSHFDALTGSIRFEQAINADWRWSAQAASQQLKTDDRVAYASGCSAEKRFDRYCANGTFDVYDYRSDNEQRGQKAASLNLKGKLATGGVAHDLGFGLQSSLISTRYQKQAYNYVGLGNVAGTAVLPADPSLTGQNTNRDEHSVEFSAQDAIRWNERFTTWLGLRSTQLQRDSIRTNGSRPTRFSQSLNTPWLAASYQLGSGQTAYASYGEGVEAQVVPNKTSQYTNAGQALPALKSRQVEVGVKGGQKAGSQDGQQELAWQVAAFRIMRPMTNLDDCNYLGITPCLGQNDGQAVHTGLEASAQWAQGPWKLGGGVTLLNAVRQGSVLNPAANGQHPANVPNWVLRAQAAWRVTGVPGLELQGNLSHEGVRPVLNDGSITLPGWTRVDAALRYDAKLGSAPTTWTVGVENLFDRRYWKESPLQYGHVYLFPGAARTVRVAMLTRF